MNGANMNDQPCSSKQVKPENENENENENNEEIIDVDQLPESEKFPKWIADFNARCLKLCGIKCPEKLDELMGLYINEVKREMVFYGPANASVVAARMNRTMIYFYLNYLDIKEFIVTSQWYEHMEELLYLYCTLELRSSQRVHRGKDSDAVICSRIWYALSIYLNYQEDRMLNVLIKANNISRKHKEIMDPIYRRLLINKHNPKTDLEYLRRLIAFKVWKRLYTVNEKKAISSLALNELKMPMTLVRTYKRYFFMPQKIGRIDNNLHKTLVTIMFDMDAVIKGYFEYLERNRRIYEHDFVIAEKKSFISEIWNTISNSDTFDDMSSVSDLFSESGLKQEIQTINEDEDDDCIIIDSDEENTATVREPQIIEVDSPPIIDLTEDDSESCFEYPMETTPEWCLDLIKKLEECVPVTPPHSIPDEETQAQAKQIEEQMMTDLSQSNIEDMCNDDALIPESNTEITSVEEIRKSPAVSLDVKISNVRRARLDSESTDLSVPDTLTSSTSEDNSDGFREITSTSHPLTDAAATSTTVTVAETTVHETTVNYEQVDSTSNLNENEEIETTETPVKSFIIERTVERTDMGLVCNDTLGQVPSPATVSNVDFEQFASTQSENVDVISSEPAPAAPVDTYITESSVSDLNIVSIKHISEEPPMEKSDALSIAFANSVGENDEFLGEDYDDTELDVGLEENMALDLHNEATEDDFQSPDIEPIAQNDYEDYVKGLDTTQYYENFYKEATSTSIENQTSGKKRKNPDTSAIRTYTKRPAKSVSVQEDFVPQETAKQPQEKERRVPLNGEKVFRFATGLWESIFTDKFKLSKLEYELFNPSVALKKLNPTQFIPNYTEYVPTNSEDQTAYYLHTVDHLHRDNLHLSRYNMKGIIERHEYMKSGSTGENPRARIIQVNRNEATASSKSMIKETDNLSHKKKRGTCSSDLNINLTLPKLESLSLNSSFQHHFCTDISACSSASKCFSESVATEVPPPNPLAHLTSLNHSQGITSYETPQTSVQQAQSQEINFKHPIAVHEVDSTPIPSTSQIIEPKQEVIPASTPILPAEVPYWHEIDSSEPPQKFDHSQCPNLLVNINLDQSEQEIHLPIKKRRVSSLKVEIKDELSYPPTPMISIAELENIETERNKAQNHRPFKTPAELKEVPPLPASYMCNINPLPTMSPVSENYNINHTYNTPTINYHVNNVPVINFQYNPHYQLPSIQPILLPVSRTPDTNWQQPNYSYIKVPLPTAGPRKQAATEEVNKKRKVGRPKTTQIPVSPCTSPVQSPSSTTVEKNVPITPWRFSVL